MDAIKQFLTQVNSNVPDHARLMISQFRGDPNDDVPRKWVAKPLTRLRQLDSEANIYLCVSAMQQNDRGEFRRRKANFAGGLLLMIDDLGSGKGAKFPLEMVDALPPTALIETSPDNYQAVYIFSELVTDRQKFENLIKGFIEKQFLGKDTGMAGVNRVFRPPYGINGKAKYGGNFRVRLERWNPENLYTIKQIAQAYKIDLNRASAKIPRGATSDKASLIENFILVRSSLRAAGMIKKEDSDLEGWIQIRCPWVSNHTAQKDNGAAIRIPDEENGFNGAFRCHHGSCADKHWRDLTQWLSDSQAEILEQININAPEEMP